jgi:hypothetical protein
VRERKSKLIIGILLAAILLMVLLPLSFVLVNRPRIPLATLPVPNAYDTLYEAGNMVSGLPDDYADTSDQEKLESFVATNAEPLKLVEQAIDQQYMLPIDYEAGMQAVLDGTGPIRQAMRLLHANARIAELDGDTALEAILYAKLFTLANKSATGGLLVHASVASAYERLALKSLKEIVGELAAPQKSEVLALLASVNRQPTDIKRVLKREHVLVKKEHGTLFGSWMIWLTKENTQPAVQRFTQSDAEVVKLNEEVLDQLR